MTKPKKFVANTSLPWHPLPYMDEYLNELESQLRSPEYVRKVKMGLAHFSTFCRSQGITHCEHIERNTLISFQGFVNTNQEWGKRHQIQILKYVRGWCNWLESVNYIPTNPWHHIKVPDIPKTPNPLSDEEIELLFEAHRRTAFSIPPFYFHRRETILALLYGWGLRIHEMCAMNLANVDLRLEYVTSPNKGGGVKHLPYPAIMKQTVQRWLQYRVQHAVVGEDALIIDMKGQRISIPNARKIITDLGKRAGIDINPHMLRDTFGMHMLDSDVPIERVAKIFGHRNIAQTRSYSRVNDHKVAESHDAAMSPRLQALLFGRTSELEKGESA